jgi:hypothetical protein
MHVCAVDVTVEQAGSRFLKQPAIYEGRYRRGCIGS